MQLKVKDFAKQQGVSESIIYRHIRQNRESLGDRVIKKAKATWITEEGQDYLRNLMIQPPPPVVGDAQTAEDLAQAEQEIERLRKKLEATQDALNKALNENGLLQGAQARLEAAEARQKLLEESRDDYKAQATQSRQEAQQARHEADQAQLLANNLQSQLDRQLTRENALMNRGLFARILNKDV